MQFIKKGLFYFNPRTREGCDCLPGVCARNTTNFNPRTREGCDLGRQGIRDRSVAISIHAPVKGATLNFSSPLALPLISIHAPVKGAT